MNNGTGYFSWLLLPLVRLVWLWLGSGKFRLALIGSGQLRYGLGGLSLTRIRLKLAQYDEV